MTEQEVLIKFASTIFNMGEDEVTELVFEKSGEDGALVLKKDAVKTLAEKDSTRIETLRKDANKFEDGYNKSKGETMSKFEKGFKEKTGFESDKQGLDLIMDWGNSLKSTDNLTEDQIKAMPAWAKAEKSIKDSFVDQINDLNKKYTDFESAVKRDQTIGVVKNKANTVFDKLNPILPKNAEVATNQKNLFFKTMTEGYEFTLDENGNPSTILKEGKRLENGHGHALSFDDFVESKVKALYEISEGGGAGANAGNSNGSGGSGTVVPKTKEEYNKAIAEAGTDNEKIAAIGKAYNEYQAQNS